MGAGIMEDPHGSVTVVVIALVAEETTTSAMNTVVVMHCVLSVAVGTLMVIGVVYSDVLH